MAEKDLDEVITHYFHRGYPYDAIVGLLEKREGLQMCVRTLKRRLRSLELKRMGNAEVIDDSELRTIIREEMRGPGSLSGYRSIWHALRLRHHIHVPRKAVAKIMKEIDPAGVEGRREEISTVEEKDVPLKRSQCFVAYGRYLFSLRIHRKVMYCVCVCVCRGRGLSK